jgi:uncharacterized protein
MIKRVAEIKLRMLAGTFKAIGVTGPRQSGKTTLVKMIFKDKPYRSLENPDTRQYAMDDPRGFLSGLPNGAVLDEVQRVPELFAYLQEIIDNSNEAGKFILTGSNNFLLQQNISQSLAGRIAYLNLLPFSINEIYARIEEIPDENQMIFTGLYPPLYARNISPVDWYPNYIRTYIERDVRQIKNISDLIVFERFMRLLAGHCGYELNLTSLANQTGVDTKTIQSWIGILESSFIIYLLKPHFTNFNKIIVKRPKLYFYDTGLVCSLLGINNSDQLSSHPLRGNLFENLVIIELVKKRTNAGKQVNLFYWRDKTGHEIDLIIDNGTTLLPVEIKSSKTINSQFFSNLLYFEKLSKAQQSLLIYAGYENQSRSGTINVMGWKQMVYEDM